MLQTRQIAVLVLFNSPSECTFLIGHHKKNNLNTKKGTNTSVNECKQINKSKIVLIYCCENLMFQRMNKGAII